MRRARFGLGMNVKIWAGISMLLALGGFFPSVGRAEQKSALTEPEPKTLQTEDRVNLHITYYRSTGDRESPVVVLLHMKDSNRFVWQAEDGFARTLQKEGYAVITVDLRHFGETKMAGGVGVANANQGGAKSKGKKSAGVDLKPAEYLAMAELDMAAVKSFIFAEHQAGNLNMNKMGIVGAEMGASVAAYYADIDWNLEPYDDGQAGFGTPRGQDVRALVFISPQPIFQGLKMTKVIPDLKMPAKNIALLVCAGSNPQDEAQSKKVFEMANPSPGADKKKAKGPNSDRMYFETFSAKLTGTDLLGQRLQLEDFMLVFFDKHLKKLDSPWRDRRSKRDRGDRKKS